MADNGAPAAPPEGRTPQEKYLLRRPWMKGCTFTPLSQSTPLPNESHPFYKPGYTKVLCVLHAVSAHDLEDNQRYQLILQHFTRYFGGSRVKVMIPRPDPSSAPVAGVGKVFVQYADLGSALSAHDYTHGIWYDGTQAHLLVRFYPEDKFAEGDYGAQFTR